MSAWMGNQFGLRKQVLEAGEKLMEETFGSNGQVSEVMPPLDLPTKELARKTREEGEETLQVLGYTPTMMLDAIIEQRAMKNIEPRVNEVYKRGYDDAVRARPRAPMYAAVIIGFVAGAVLTGATAIAIHKATRK